MLKSCLKCSTSSPRLSHSQELESPGSPSSLCEQISDCDANDKEQKRKFVTFSEEGEEEVFFVDDWDRSPAAVTERLTYKDVYELKELRITLPRINLAAKRRTRQSTRSV